jgi:RNA polymerase sigma factor (sigma-70 family)
MPAPPDADLVARTRLGDDRAFAALVDRHSARARAIARSIVGDADEAEDRVQDAFVRASRNLDLLADPARFAAWLGRIVVGVSIDWLRARRMERRHVAAGDAAIVSVPDERADAQARLEHEELAGRVLDAVHALPERYRVPLSLYHLDGLSHARIADALGIPPGTVRSLVTRARERLRAELLPLTDVTDAMSDDPFAERATPRLLHILNGDSVRMTLERSDVPGDHAVWADALHDGRVPPFDVGADRWRGIRADFIASAGWATHDEAVATYARWDAGVARAPEYDEAVIWLEHDLFDQLLLIRHLAWFAERPGDEAARTTLSLVCIGEWPGMPDFKGLGELAPAELASLLGTRQRVTQRQLALGRRAWRAFTGDDPRAIERFLAEEDVSPLPFLAGALRRLLEELPAADDGLARTDRQLLSLVAGGETDPLAVWTSLHRMETQYYVADASYLRRLERLAEGPAPLLRVTLGDPRWSEGGALALTPAGRDTLAGRGPLRPPTPHDWIGGARLADGWRWDRLRGAVVR